MSPIDVQLEGALVDRTLLALARALVIRGKVLEKLQLKLNGER